VVSSLQTLELKFCMHFQYLTAFHFHSGMGDQLIKRYQDVGPPFLRIAYATVFISS